MKKTLSLIIMALMALSLAVLSACKKEGGGNGEEVSGKYVDLGLSSGTKWKAVNEENAADVEYAFFTYDEAIAAYGNKLPSREQWEELLNECSWSWTGMGYKMVGPSGKSISLPAAGSRDCLGFVSPVGSGGGYWSSTPLGSDDAWCLYFVSGELYTGRDHRCNGFSVRLVQD